MWTVWKFNIYDTYCKKKQEGNKVKLTKYKCTNAELVFMP